MKKKIFNIGLIVTSLFGYLEWGQNKSMFLFQGEMEVLQKVTSDPASVVHPFTVLPLLGQILLCYTLLQKVPGKYLTIAGIIGIGTLLGFMLFVGFIGWNARIILSTVPFLTLAIITIWDYRNTKM